jgi:hypothetical protein
VLSSTQNIWSNNVDTGAKSVTIGDIPVGTYTINLSVYNNSDGSTTPKLTGSTSDVAVSKDSTTTVKIKCRPVSPSDISSPFSTTATIAKWAEQWYRMSVSSGTTYYFTQSSPDFRFAVFDASGSFIASSTGYLAYAATYSGILYAALVLAYPEGSATTESGTFAISTTAPTLNEGSTSSPVALALNQSHDFKVGANNSSTNTSYYYFTTTTSGNYALDFPNNKQAYLSPRLYTSSSFSGMNVVQSTGGSRGGSLFFGLSANTPYYLMINNNQSNNAIVSGMIMDPAAISAASPQNEGSPSSPVSLSLGSSRSASVGYRGYDNASYYCFTTGSGVDYSIGISNLNPSSSYFNAVFYSDSSFTGSSEWQNLWGSHTSGSLFLAPSKTYYLCIMYNASLLSASTFGLTISSASEPTYIALPISTDGSWTTGSPPNNESSLWFKALVSSGTKYVLYKDDKNEGSGNYSGYFNVSAYKADRINAYFASVFRNYTAGTVFTVPSDQSIVYIRVSGNGSLALKLIKAPDSGSITVTAK